MSEPDAYGGPAAFCREAFRLPAELVYLDGNSLGPLPVRAEVRVAEAVGREWGQSLIRGWNDAGWYDLADRAAARIAPLIGAAADTVAVGDSTSVNLYKALAAALDLRPDRTVVLSDAGNFPTDLYVAGGVTRTLGGGRHLRTLPGDEVEAAINSDVAVVMLTEVDYRTGARSDMAAVTAAAHRAGALAVWDLAHSAGAFPVDLAATGADFAVGCGYKFLNGGPGAPGFIYVAPRHLEAVRPALSGWFGHEAPFDFAPGYTPAAGIGRMKVGTPPVLSLTALESALTVFDDVDMGEIAAASQALADIFSAEIEARCPDLALATPRSAARRGSQVAFRHPEGYAIVQALIAEGVIGDFRAPDILRFGISPLYIGAADIRRAAGTLERVMAGRLWDRPVFRKRARVT